MAVAILGYVVVMNLDLPHSGRSYIWSGTCYWTDAMVPYVACKHVPFGTLVIIFLNMGLWMIYSIMALFASPIGFIPFLICWSPVIYIFLYVYMKIRLKRATTGTGVNSMPSC